MKAARWLRRALLDLDDAYCYVAADNPAAARRLVDQIEEGVLQLARHPRLGRTGRVAGTRELVIAGTPFLVVYKLEADGVAILTVLHGARRWPRR
ncbi:MAG: type II toxin-antitoxin system RelE/ParE family toxin [Bryobacteraceae bacterium]